jgi:drug/metabolite transporter (DMT)-like permease
MVTVFALAAALMYGSADFLGGAATQRAHVLSVARLSVLAGLGVVLVAAAASGEPVRTAGVGWGVAAGAFGGVGLIIFYAGLAVGPMSIVAPISALVSTVLPVGVALAEGERSGARVYAGAAACLLAIVLVSSAGGARQAATGASQHVPGRAIAYGIASGVSFGLFYLFLRNAGQSGAFWPVVSARIAGAVVILAAAAAVRPGRVLRGAGGRVFLTALGSGLVDASANIFYVIATREGLFGLAVVLTSLYPGVTVLLARILLGERQRWVQRAGLALAGLGVLLVTV